MFRNLAILLFVGVCSANFLESEFKRLQPLAKGVENFAINIPGKTEHEEVKSDLSGVFNKLGSSILMRGVPQGPATFKQSLPLMVRYTFSK